MVLPCSLSFNSMEPEVKVFLIAIVQSISMMLLWMMLNSYFGIKLGLLFAENGTGIWNIIYYVLAIASFAWVIRYIFRKWKNLPKFES
jgi:ABC-type dipeptide/oligopeptide/nickel transport system permease subunit